VSGRYRTIVADPPWHQNRGPEFIAPDRRQAKPVVRTRATNASQPLAFPTMTVDEIKALPVKDMAADDAHLYLWVTNRYVPDGYEIARAWGFKPVSLLTWCKAPMGIGLGGAFTQTTEFVIFARRGRDVRLRKVDTSWWLWSSRGGDGRHSANSTKPDGFLDLVEQVSPEPRAELFSRRARLYGWDYPIGDQALGGAAA
jgi:N6-adenosine-specific RNA methylase IME4